MRGLIYLISHYLVWGAFGFFLRFTVRGLENVPREGALLVASNHMSYLDPVVVGNAFPRELYYMAKSELFDIPLFSSLIRLYNAFPVERGRADLKAIETTLKLLNEGKSVLIFPEGTRSRTGRLQRARGGVGIIAYKAKVPVLPTYISGTQKVLPPGRAIPRLNRVEVRFGKPVPLQDLYDEEESKRIYVLIAERITAAIAMLGGEWDLFNSLMAREEVAKAFGSEMGVGEVSHPRAFREAYI